MGKKIDHKITQALSKDHPCYVLITCDSPSADGQMKVEMTYEGEPEVIAFLLGDAQLYIDSSHEAEAVALTTPQKNKVLRFKDEI